MKYKFIAAVMFLLTSMALYGQDQIFSIKPENPKAGDKLFVTYNPGAKEAQLIDVKEIIMYAKLVQNNGVANLAEVKMNKQGNIWQGSFEMKDTLAKVLLFRFDSGELTDDNNKNCWSSQVYNSKGYPVEKSHGTMGLLYRYGGITGFPVPVDKEKAEVETALESKMYPDKKGTANLLSKLFQTYNDNSSKKEVVERVVNEIVKYYSDNKSDETIVTSVTAVLRAMKQPAKAEEIAADYLKSNPKGKFAEQERMNKVYAETDKQKRVDLIKKYQNEIPNLSDDEKDGYEYMLVQALIELKKYDDAYKVVSTMKKQNGTMYNSLAWDALEKGEIIEKATGWAKMGADLLRNPDPSTKPSDVTLKDWKKANQTALSYVLDTYAFGLLKLGKTEEAEKCYEEVFNADKSTLSEDYYSRYVECLNKNKKYEKALSFAEEAISLGKSSDKLIEEYKTAFLKTNGSESDFDKKMAAVKSEDLKKAKEKLAKELINKPAPIFSLKSLDGKTVKLTDLKGKVVVVDFWATWCGPCKASFPTLQKVYEKYKNNKNIVILAVNTWENETGKAREKTVKDFIKENKYTFKVLFDLDDKTKAFVSQFGVDGIPTKFIIDKEGNIQFKTVGFMGEKTMLDELDAQFEMLLKGDYKAFLKK